MRKTRGMEVDTIIHRVPQNNLPKWVKEIAVERGYGDAKHPITLVINEQDIQKACDAQAHGNGAKCVMAQAGKRLGAERVYFYRTTVWIDWGSGPIQRFQTTKSIYNNVIEPFDRGDHDAIAAGNYALTPPKPSNSLGSRKPYKKRGRKQQNPGDRSKTPVSHTERVVLASQAES
jgi:hypothetical protein